jgi:hypothetical protein
MQKNHGIRIIYFFLLFRNPLLCRSSPRPRPHFALSPLGRPLHQPNLALARRATRLPGPGRLGPSAGKRLRTSSFNGRDRGWDAPASQGGGTALASRGASSGLADRSRARSRPARSPTPAPAKPASRPPLWRPWLLPRSGAGWRAEARPALLLAGRRHAGRQVTFARRSRARRPKAGGSCGGHCRLGVPCPA